MRLASERIPLANAAATKKYINKNCFVYDNDGDLFNISYVHLFRVYKGIRLFSILHST